MKKFKRQLGIGVIEILAALFVLAVGALGVAMLQLRSVDMISSASDRSKGMIISSDLIQKIRSNTSATVTQYANAFATGLKAGDSIPCPSGGVADCTVNNRIRSDIIQTLNSAAASNQIVSMVQCNVSGTSTSRFCVVVAWGKTTPTKGSSAPACFTDAGSYLPLSTCYRSEGMR